MNGTKMTERKQRTLNHSYVEEAEDDLHSALGMITLAMAEDSVTTLRQAMTHVRLAHSRLNEAILKAVAPDGQATIGEEPDSASR